MIKFFQFIKWCGRKIWKHTSSFILWTPVVIYKSWKTLKLSLRKNTAMTILIWGIASMFLWITSGIGVFIYETKTNSPMPLNYIMEIEGLSNIVLLAIVGIFCSYDIFKEEQQEIISRLKK